MPYNTDALLRDANGNPGPQLYNAIADAFYALQGQSDGGIFTHEKPDGTGVLATSFYTSSALESAKAVKTSAGMLFGLSVYNNSAGTLYLMVFDNSGGTPPATGAVPNLIPRAVATLSTFDLTSAALTKFGWKFVNGLYVALSTTQATYTADGSAVGYFNAFYL